MPPGMKVTVIPATADDRERVPESVPAGVTATVLVVLPSANYARLMREQEDRSFEYHLVEHPEYHMGRPIAFDADAFVEATLAYCRAQTKPIDAVMAFDCFPTLLASVINDEMALPGPSFRSVFLCCNKYYMRRELNPSMQITTPSDEPPNHFPAVLKVSDTQFYVGTRICLDPKDWKDTWRDLAAGLMSTGDVATRKKFYYKWACHFGWAADMAWATPSDICLAHVEPLIANRGEYQAEVVVLSDGTMNMADTGDIEHGPGQLITVFKTPGTFTITPKLQAWLRQVVGGITKFGYKSAAMDVEFVRCVGEEEQYELVEINSRYSYMGNLLHLGIAAEAQVGEWHTPGIDEHHEIRNLLNRTRLALGAPPATMPSRDSPDVCKLAAMIYTERLGPIDAFFDKAALTAMINDTTLDAFAPKPVFLSGTVSEADLREYNGWAKIGCILLTMEDDLQKINSQLDTIVRRLFRGEARGFLPVEVVDEDGDGPTMLTFDVLDNGKSVELPPLYRVQ